MSRKFVLDNDSPVADVPDFSDALNEEQNAVVTAGDGPLLVIAGAGTGKTRALTYRVAHLIGRGIPAEQILLLTFTNRASTEMLNRVRGLVGAQAKRVWGGTFHSVGRRVLREYADRIGYPNNFGIVDREDAISLMKQCIAEHVDAPSGSRFPRAGLLVNVLSNARNTSRSASDVFAERCARFIEHADTVRDVFLAYQSKKFEFGVMDFDDLLTNWLRLLNEFDDVRAALTRRFKHVLVDEYQDTNAIQAALVDAMASGHGNVTVVGDDCQSIYSFRGAEFTNIIEFPDRYEGVAVRRLETNYRSTPQILDLANASIARNKRQFQKMLRPVRDDALLAGHVRCTEESQQSQFVAQRILQLRDEGVEMERVAVLYRAHWQSVELQVELSRRNIPFTVHSGQRFFEQRHVKDVLAFLRFSQNPRDELSFRRVAELAHGVGSKTAERIFAYLNTFDSLGEALDHPETRTLVGRRGAADWGKMVDVLGALQRPAAEHPVEALRIVVDEYYEDHAMRAFDNGENRVRDLEALSTLAASYDEADDFLQTLALTGDVTGVDQLSHEAKDESVVLSSIHQAKGLEFDTVFVIWLSEDRFPSPQASGDELEEERRLFYVAITRAERELYLTTPCIAWDRAQGRVALRDSLFIREIEHIRPPVLERIELVRG